MASAVLFQNFPMLFQNHQKNIIIDIDIECFPYFD